MNIKRVKLVYYSPTGTSEKTVKAIQKGIDIDYDIVDLTLPDSESKNYTFDSTDIAVIAVPVYSGRVPPVAVKRISRLKAQNTPTVLVAVYGNREFEDALLELKNITEPNGFKAFAAAAFIGEHSFDTPETPIATGRPDAEDNKKAKEFGEKVKQKLEKLTKLDEFEVPGNHPYREGGKTGGRNPVTDPDTCILCGMCARVCPTGCVTVSDIVETDTSNCTACSACVKNCPTGARHWEHEGVLKAAKWLSTDYAKRKEPEFFL
ncbi:MAG: EFR1 family ferrodoxin [Candidatus Bathyarchaeota archaeon]|nr:EFR1 family ferrodoxin [Candidatus Bathyarchaeota archaeon]